MIRYVIFIFFASFLIGCGDDESSSTSESGELNIQFKLVYGNEPFQMFKNYKYPETGDEFFMSRLSFYLAEVKLKNATDKIDIKDIDYLNLTNTYTGSTPNKGFEYKIKNIKPGNYSNLQFGIGVPAEYNNKQPKDFTPGTILSSSAEYWSSWKSYVFFKAEGLIGLNGGPVDNEFALHTGANEAYLNFDLTKDIQITKGKTTETEVIIDVRKLFLGKELFDIRNTQQIHSLSQMPQMKIFVGNIASAVK